MSDLPHLEFFGRNLMNMVRDRTIYEFDSTCSGDTMATDLISKFTQDEIQAIRKIVIESIDTTIFNVLTMLQDNEDVMSMNITFTHETKDIVKMSDGLGGELFGEFGWFNKYSEYGEPEQAVTAGGFGQSAPGAAPFPRVFRLKRQSDAWPMIT